MTSKSRPSIAITICALLCSVNAFAIGYHVSETDEAIFILPSKVQDDHFEVFKCAEHFKSFRYRSRSQNKLRLDQLPNCHRITTEFVPISLSEIRNLSPASLPTLWRNLDDSKLVDLLQSNSFSDVSEQDFRNLDDSLNQNFNKRISISRKKAATLRLRVQTQSEGQSTLDSSRPHTTCTATMMKLEGQCHLFSNEHCVQSNPAFLYIDAPELTTRASQVFEKQVATEWDLLSLTIPQGLKAELCIGLENQTRQKMLQNKRDNTKAHYSLGYSGRSGTRNMDIFSSSIPGQPTQLGSTRKEVKLEFSGGKASIYNYIPTYRGMSGGVITDIEGSPLCLIHRAVPQQDTPQCIDTFELYEFTQGKLDRADPQDDLLFPEIFLRTHARVDLDEQVSKANNNQVAPGNSYISPGNTQIPPGNTYISPGNTHIPPGNTQIPPGNTYVSPGNTHIPPGNTYITPSNHFPSTSSSPFLLFGNSDCLRKFIANSGPTANLGEFIEAMEGIVDYRDSKSRELLAVRCGPFSPWEQIDGHEDYYNKLSPYNLATKSCPDIALLSERDKIYRESDGSVPSPHAQGLLKRLHGSFLTDESKPLGRVLHYNQLPSDTPKLTPQKRSSATHLVTLDSQKNTLSLRLGAEAIPRSAPIDLNFKIVMSSDAKTITLKPKKIAGNFPGVESVEEMTCKNQNFYKLICKGKSSALSLSMANRRDDKLSIRFSSYDPMTRKMIHTHGDVYEAN